MKLVPDRAGRYYPSSFLKLLLIALALVALPLALAFLNAALYLDRLADQSRRAVSQSALAARESRLLTEQVTGLERVVRQYLILDDEDLLNDYAKVRESFRETTSRLSLLPLDEAPLGELNRAIDAEQALYERLRKSPIRAADKPALIEGYVNLSENTRAVLDAANELADREVESLRHTAEGGQRVLWLQLLATIPIGLVIAILAAFLLARPVRELESAIRRLGSGDLHQAIRVSGPQDFEYLGGRLEWLRQRLAELEDQKRRFLRHISHELKTPLTALREGAELLADGTGGALTEVQREISGIVRQKSIQLQEMIEDLLNYNQAQDSIGRLALAPVNLEEVAETVLDDHRLAAGARALRLDARLESVSLVADPDKLRVVVDNLISNAVKYSPDGGTIVLALRREREDAVIDVIDEGPGIPPSEREHIFNWFYRAGNTHHGRVQGSGLGLAIAADFVAAHGGRLELVESSEPGAHFRVVLPLAGANIAEAVA